jgi:serine/threonine protein phosphatase PrpC
MEGDTTKLCTANVGDARIVLVRDRQAVQMSAGAYSRPLFSST